MPKKKSLNNSTPAQAAPELSERDKVFAATNDPSLAPDKFKLGDRTFKVVHLRYDDYIKFLSLLKPFIDGLGKAVAAKAGMQIPGITLVPDKLDASMLMDFCLAELPEMVRIVCAQTDPNVTVEQVKEWAGDPFTLCAIVLKQIALNNMIGKIASFFATMLPLLTRMGLAKTKPTTKPTE